jgi:hypothetical protein
LKKSNFLGAANEMQTTLCKFGLIQGWESFSEFRLVLCNLGYGEGEGGETPQKMCKEIYRAEEFC